ncbi:MAG: TerB family tellurite resistance protein [Deltaproteobacteria bacterium]|nr:TerB family tellurite resistance protein [Deltaproteobacteria bacterium]
MLDMIKRFFSKPVDQGAEQDERNSGHDIQVATCALFLEMAQIDESFNQEEMETILLILKSKYGLSPEYVDELIAEAKKELDDSIDYWQFAKKINENYSNEEKIKIIESLWQIVFVDEKMDKYENYLMHKLSTLLRLSHAQLIDAKLRVLHSS